VTLTGRDRGPKGSAHCREQKNQDTATAAAIESAGLLGIVRGPDAIHNLTGENSHDSIRQARRQDGGEEHDGRGAKGSREESIAASIEQQQAELKAIVNSTRADIQMIHSPTDQFRANLRSGGGNSDHVLDLDKHSPVCAFYGQMKP
jgi:hypothetical protein